MTQKKDTAKDQDVYVLYWKNCNWNVHERRKLTIDLQHEEMISEWKSAELDSYWNNFYDYFWDSEYVTIWKKKELDENGLDTEPLTGEERKKIWLWILEDMAEDGLPLWQELTKDEGFRIGIDRSAAEFGKKFMRQIRENRLYEKLKNDGIL